MNKFQNEVHIHYFGYIYRVVLECKFEVLFDALTRQRNFVNQVLYTLLLMWNQLKTKLLIEMRCGFAFLVLGDNYNTK